MPKVSEEHLAARRRQILDAALIRFSEQGFHATPMSAIFEEAGLSPGAVYRYFKSKEEIVLAIASETLSGFAASLEPDAGETLGPGDVIDRLLDSVESTGMRAERLRLAVQIWGEALRNPRLLAFLREVLDTLTGRMAADLRAAQERGALDPRLDPDASARVLLATVQGFVIQINLFPDLDIGGFRAAARELVAR